MLVSGVFPTGFFKVDSCQRRDLDEKNQVSLTTEQATAALGPFIKSRMDSHATVYRSSNRDAAWFGPYSCTFNDTQVPNPPSRILNCERPVRPANKDFVRRSKAGEIVLSPFEDWTMILSYQNGVVGEKFGNVLSAYAFLSSTGLGYPQSDAHTSDWCTIGNYQYRGRLRIDYQRYVGMSEKTPYQLGWVDPRPEDIDEISCIIHGADVQEELSDHNRRLIDVATAMAEMPETVKSIINGCKQVLRLYKDAKRKELRLKNLVKGPKGSSATAHKQWIKDQKDRADAIADVWLNFRYNITPTKILIEDMIKYHFGLETEFIRSRKRVEYNIDFPFPANEHWSCPDPLVQNHRTMIKARLRADAVKADAYLSSNPFVTAWELVPLSFVVDWFLTVGDFFSSLMPVPSVQQGATYSWKTDGEYLFYHDETNARVSVRLNHYKRSVINPSDYCRVYLNVDLSTNRQLDALALSWKMFVRNFFKP